MGAQGRRFESGLPDKRRSTLRGMNTLVSNAGKAFLKAAVAVLIVGATGILHQTTLHSAELVTFATVAASIAAGLAAITTFIPQLTFAPYLPAPYGSMLDSFVRAALGYFVASVIGILNMPSLSGWHAAAVAAVVGAINAGLQAVQGTLTLGQFPVQAYGIRFAGDSAAYSPFVTGITVTNTGAGGLTLDDESGGISLIFNPSHPYNTGGGYFEQPTDAPDQGNS